MRAGALARERLALLAFLGDPAARAALEAPPEVPEDLEALAAGLSSYGAEVQPRTALLVAERLVADLGDEAQAFALERAPAALRDWLACPCEAHRVAARLLADGLGDLAVEGAQAEGASDSLPFAVEGLVHALGVVAAHRDDLATFCLGRALDLLGPEVDARAALVAALGAWAREAPAGGDA